MKLNSQKYNSKMQFPLFPAFNKMLQMKAKYPDAIVLMREEDFYEMLEDDAKIVAKILHFTLLKSKNADCQRWAFPHHSLDMYLPILVKAGKRIAIIEPLD